MQIATHALSIGDVGCGNFFFLGPYVTIQLPLNLLLILPKPPRLALDIMYRKHYWSLRPLINRLCSIPLRHIRINISRTAAVNQHSTALLLLTSRKRPRASNQSRLAHSIRRRRETGLLLLARFDGRGKLLHQGCDVVFSLGGEEAVANVIGVLCEMAGHGGEVYETAGRLEEGEEGVACFEGFVVVAVERCLYDVGVCDKVS
jgi:hypothetical protein